MQPLGITNKGPVVLEDPRGDRVCTSSNLQKEHVLVCPGGVLLSIWRPLDRAPATAIGLCDAPRRSRSVPEDVRGSRLDQPTDQL